MKYNPEDPRLTTYALGEMPAEECAEFEASLDDEARAEIEAIRETAALLRRELAMETTPSLTDTQRTAIHQAVGTVRPRKRRFHWVMWAAAAACFAALVSVMTWPTVRERMRVAKQEREAAGALTSTTELGMDEEDATSPKGEMESKDAGAAPLTYAQARDKYEQRLLKDPYDLDAIRGIRRLYTEMEKLAAKRRNEVVGNMSEPHWDGNLPIPPLAAGPTGVKRPAPVGKPNVRKATPRGAAEKEIQGDGGMGGGGGMMGGGAGGKAGAGMGGGLGRGVEDTFAFGFVVPAPEPPKPKSVIASADRRARPTRAAPSAAPAARRAPAPTISAPPAGNIRFNAVAGAGGAETKVPMVGKAPRIGDLFQAKSKFALGRTVYAAGYSDADTGVLLDGGDVTGRPKRLNEKKREAPSREAYDRIRDNPYKLVRQDPLSTFSIDVDTASYANVRRFLTQNQLPPKDAVRIEELVNYFRYNYEEPKGERPFSVSVDLTQCPWAPKHRLARVALKGREPDLARRPASNLVFLLDVSGSMNQPNKLPLVKKSMKMLVDRLGENDRVAIVVYAGASGLVLPSTNCDRKEQVLGALDRLSAGGSTNGGAGIQLAYQTAVSHFIKGGTNRVLLATDGDFNVGVSNRGDLTRLIEEKAKSGVFLTVLGFGNGNLQDATLEQLSGKGNGTYAYIDSAREARKVMVEQIGGTLLTIAKDVKIQVEFNPARIGAYRLIGYENRMLRHQDFNDDKKDAGEIGAGLTVTAFYELVPRGVKIEIPGVDPLKYQGMALGEAALANEAMTVKLRYKLPDSDTSTLLTATVKDEPKSVKQMSDDYVFATSVAAFGMVLRDSPYKGSASLALAEELAQTGARRDPHGYRKEFLELLRKTKALKR